MKRVLDGTYFVSEAGDVYSQKAGKFLLPQDNGHGYKFVNTHIDGIKKQFYVHRLVAEAFVENPFGYKEVNHKDENRGNNRADNLEWCTSKYNKNYGTRSEKYSKSRSLPVRCVETGTEYANAGAASSETGIHRGSIAACCNGYRNTKTAGGFHWQYVNSPN